LQAQNPEFKTPSTITTTTKKKKKPSKYSMEKQHILENHEKKRKTWVFPSLDFVKPKQCLEKVYTIKMLILAKQLSVEV
jgi:hypothetical protein